MSGQGRRGRRSCGADAPHHFDELLVVDLAVAVNIHLPDHLINLLVRELLTKISHDELQLCSRDETVAVLVEHLAVATISPHCSLRSKHCNTTAARTHTKSASPQPPRLTLKVSRISSSESVSFILCAMSVKNSGKSMAPLLSASTWSARRDTTMAREMCARTGSRAVGSPAARLERMGRCTAE